MRGPPLALAAVTLSAVACVGTVVGDETTAGPGGGGASGSPGVSSPPNLGGSGGVAMPSRPRAPLRRLSHAQYNNTVRDLLGDTSRPADAFLVEEVPGAFAGSVALAQASPAAVEQYRSAAERAAATAVENLAALLPCQPQTGEESCAAAFIGAF